MNKNYEIAMTFYDSNNAKNLVIIDNNEDTGYILNTASGTSYKYTNRETYFMTIDIIVECKKVESIEDGMYRFFIDIDPDEYNLSQEEFERFDASLEDALVY